MSTNPAWTRSLRQLSPEDARFVYADTGNSHANITLVQIYDPASAPGGRLRFKELLRHVESRLHRAPLFRERLMRVPFDLDLPYWIEDDRFDLEYHVRHIALPEPGDWRQFCIQASRIHARPLDLSRPLWELYLIDRLDSFDELPPQSFAILLKLHHAAVDLAHGADVALLLNDEVPDAPPPGPPEPWFPSPPPSSQEMLARGLAHNLRAPFSRVQPLARAVGHLVPGALGLVGQALLNPESFTAARFNAELSPHRVFDTRRFEAAQFERIRALVRGATLDDAVLAVCGGALRRYLEHHDELPKASLIALAPVQVHGTDAGPGSTEAATRRVRLATDVADPVARLRTIHQATARDSRGRTAVADARDIEEVAEHAPAAAFALVARSLHAQAFAARNGFPTAHCLVANVPGPTRTLYFRGARMTYMSAMMPIADGVGLTLSVTSYLDKVLVSLTACREQVPDPEDLAQCLRDSFQEYLALADGAGPAVTPGRAPPRRRGRKAPRKRPAGTAATRPRAGRAGPRRST